MSGDQRNWIEKLAQKIPGYSGYVEKERRRDIDKLHREHVANRLRGLKAPITDVIRDLSSSGRLFEVGPLDQALKKLDRIENRVRFASYGYAGFFDVVKIEDDQLNAIYQFDLALVDSVDDLESRVQNLKPESPSADSLKAAAVNLSDAIDAFDRAFDNRYSAINRFGREEAPGRPLFN